LKISIDILSPGYLMLMSEQALGCVYTGKKNIPYVSHCLWRQFEKLGNLSMESVLPSDACGKISLQGLTVALGWLMTKLERPARDRHSSLLHTFVN
jgi:hypothetical protein